MVLRSIQALDTSYGILENGLTFGIINEQMLSFNMVGL